MNRRCAFLLLLGLGAVACAAFAGSAQPCAAALCQTPPPDAPGERGRDMRDDEPILDEPPFDEPPGPPDGRHHPGRRAEGPGPGCEPTRPGCIRDADGPDEGKVARGCDEMCQRFLTIVHDKLPEHYDRLIQLREENPDRFDGVMRRLRPVVREYLDLVEAEPELAETIFEDFRIDEQLRELSVEYRSAIDRHDADVAKQLEEKIRDLVRRQAEMSIKRREARLRIAEKRLNEQLERLHRHRERFEEERARMEEYVNDRVQDVKEGRPPRAKAGRGKGGFGPGEREERRGRDSQRSGDESRRGHRGKRMRDRATTQPVQQGEPDRAEDNSARRTQPVQ